MVTSTSASALRRGRDVVAGSGIRHVRAVDGVADMTGGYLR
jgi:hypothetical protein